MSAPQPEVTAALLADVVAVVLIDLLAVLPGHKGLATQERLANRLYDRGIADDMFGTVALALMRRER